MVKTVDRIFVVSDTHFGHVNILRFKNDVDKPIRPNFKDVDDMNEVMIRNWNSVVTPQDKVYHLGDVFFGPKDKADSILSRLNGKKRLILGNHDDGKSEVLHKHFQKIMMWRIFKEYSTVLSHVPLHETTLHEGSQFNVHGHIHQNQSPSKHHICACVEHINYTPVLLEDLVKAHSRKVQMPIVKVGGRNV
jgi:calcineurin-like phosphoesterase family protein